MEPSKGIEPLLTVYETVVLPLDEQGLKNLEPNPGIEPESARYKLAVLPLDE